MKNNINGKPLEFGNEDQIKFLKKAEDNMSDMLEYGISTNDGRIHFKADVHYMISFNCFQCGCRVYKNDNHCDIDLMECVDDIIDDLEIICSACKCKYAAVNGIISLVENPRKPELVTNKDHRL